MSRLIPAAAVRWVNIAESVYTDRVDGWDESEVPVPCKFR
jgi:hypothetical protein